MGVKTHIDAADIAPFWEARTLHPTQDGVRDTVYWLDNDYVLKVFEEASVESAQREWELLASLAPLPVPRALTPVFALRGKSALVYAKCAGTSPNRPTENQIRGIGAFLRDLHGRTLGKQSANLPLFKRERLAELIARTGHEPFSALFAELRIDLRDEGIIHGDLFPDNASFCGDELGCVYDWSEACNGDFTFDLAVTALAWCADDAHTRMLLDAYGYTEGIERFRPYVRYAGLYYSVTRFLAGRDHTDLWEKIQ